MHLKGRRRSGRDVRRREDVTEKRQQTTQTKGAKQIDVVTEDIADRPQRRREDDCANVVEPKVLLQTSDVSLRNLLESQSLHIYAYFS